MKKDFNGKLAACECGIPLKDGDEKCSQCRSGREKTNAFRQRYGDKPPQPTREEVKTVNSAFPDRMGYEAVGTKADKARQWIRQQSSDTIFSVDELSNGCGLSIKELHPITHVLMKKGMIERTSRCHYRRTGEQESPVVPNHAIAQNMVAIGEKLGSMLNNNDSVVHKCTRKRLCSIAAITVTATAEFLQDASLEETVMLCQDLHNELTTILERIKNA